MSSVPQEFGGMDPEVYDEYLAFVTDGSLPLRIAFLAAAERRKAKFIFTRQCRSYGFNLDQAGMPFLVHLRQKKLKDRKKVKGEGNEDDDMEGLEVDVNDVTCAVQRVIKKGDVEQLVRTIHSELGHLGEKKTLDAIRKQYYWCNPQRDVTLVIRTCEHCQRNRKSNSNAFGGDALHRNKINRKPKMQPPMRPPPPPPPPFDPAPRGIYEYYQRPMAGTVMNGTHVQLNDGNFMPLLGLGCWQGEPEPMAAAVEFALRNGYRHIDTAFSYMNEEAVGEGIRRWGGDRRGIFVTTKLPSIALGEGKVEEFLKKSLKKLGLDYVDLYLIHAPVGLKYVDDHTMFPLDKDGHLMVDYSTDHVRLWKEMEAVKQAGLARSIGVSNFSTAQIRRLLAIGKVPPAVNQLEMHVEFQQQEMQKFSRETGIVLTSYATFGSPGRRGTRFEAGCVIPSVLENPVVALAAKLVNRTPAQVLLRYFIQQGIVVIPKSVTPSRIIENSQVFDWCLPEEAMAALRSIDRGEEARSFNFLKNRGFELHPECPVNRPAL